MTKVTTATNSFKSIKQSLNTILSSIYKNKTNEEVQNQWHDLWKTLANIEKESKEQADNKAANNRIHENIFHTKEYLRRLIICFYKDCHPDKYTGWNAVDPKDPKWKNYYIPLCLSDCKRDLVWIDHIVEVEVKRREEEEKAKKRRGKAEKYDF